MGNWSLADNEASAVIGVLLTDAVWNARIPEEVETFDNL